MKRTSAEIIKQDMPELEQVLRKTAFLSYYISMYNTINGELGLDNSDVTVDEIFDFMQDLKHEGQENIPLIAKEDIIFSFMVLRTLGICYDIR